MKFAVVLAALLVAVLAKPQNPKDATIVSQSSDNIGLDGYSFAYKTSDNVERVETAEVKNAGSENAILAVRGTIKWIAADGKEYSLSYIADENGFQPTGAHLPTRR